MKAKLAKIESMIAEMEAFIQEAKAQEQAFAHLLMGIHPLYQNSARNLIHYWCLRQHDLRSLQKKLRRLGMSRLAHSGPHVLASFETTKAYLEGFLSDSPIQRPKVEVSIKKAEKLLQRHTEALLGPPTQNRETRIMVTMPSEAALDAILVQSLRKSGMNLARINCAHDGPEAWSQMITHLRDGSDSELPRPKITMDLAGPKIRTGTMEAGPKVRRFKPNRDVRGRVVRSTRVWIGPMTPREDGLAHLPISVANLPQLRNCSKLNLRDTRGKMRSLKIQEVQEDGVIAESKKTIYVETGLPMMPEGPDLRIPIPVGELPALEQGIWLKEGDFFWLTREPIQGRPAQRNEVGEVLTPAEISCTAPAIFDSIKTGDPISLDDGKFEGVIAKKTKVGVLVHLQQVKSGGASLKADKGINFPESKLKIRGLTDKDRQDLTFVAANADLMNVSFVNSASDVREVLDLLPSFEREEPLGVVLKIETQSGFNHLPEILLTAMQTYPVGIMIARGDLAVETGWENMARVQEEMLAICHAAHIPVIWATQVLESLAKKGVPSRAEITDAGMAQRAECVMLNKGPAIVPALKLLDTILRDRAAYMEKSLPMLPPLERANRMEKSS